MLWKTTAFVKLHFLWKKGIDLFQWIIVNSTILPARSLLSYLQVVAPLEKN